MFEIKITGPKPDEMTKMMMDSIKAEINKSISKLKCPTHNEHAKITMNGTNVSYSCCCEEFSETVGKALGG